MADLFPSDDVEYFKSAEEVILYEDCIETDVLIAGWADKKFRIRALNFGQQIEINQKSLDEKGQLQEDEFVYWTIVHGVVRPKFSHAQAVKLREKNGEWVKSLSDEIWSIGRVSKKFFDEYLEEQKKYRAEFNKENKA